MPSISNNLLQIEVALKGAELQHIFHKQYNLEYLWSGDAAFWSKKSPVLFPIVGGLKGSKYIFNDKEYTLGRHGFARDTFFKLTAETSTSLTFSLTDDEETLQHYPFHFVFSVQYTLLENTLEITYIVENKDKQELFFSVGAHPAFKVPLIEGTGYEDYYLHFEKEETAGRYLLSNEGLIENDAVAFFSGTRRLDLKKELFYTDALVFKQLRSNYMAIASDKTTHGLKVIFEGFPYMGIWAAKDADFVCIEPWYGIADHVYASGQLKDKEGILQLPAGEVFKKAFSIEFY